MLQVFGNVALIHPRLTQAAASVSCRCAFSSSGCWHGIESQLLIIANRPCAKLDDAEGVGSRSWPLHVEGMRHPRDLFSRDPHQTVFSWHTYYMVIISLSIAAYPVISSYTCVVAECHRSQNSPDLLADVLCCFLVFSLLWRSKFEDGIFRDQDVTVSLMTIRGNNHTSLHFTHVIISLVGHLIWAQTRNSVTMSLPQTLMSNPNDKFMLLIASPCLGRGLQVLFETSNSMTLVVLILSVHLIALYYGEWRLRIELYALIKCWLISVRIEWICFAG